MAQMLSPQQAFRLVQDENAILVDIREPDEYARMRIAGARLMPVSVLACLPEDEDKERPAIFFCYSGGRSKVSEPALDARGHERTYILEGGIQGWRAADLPLVTENLPLPIMRQVQLIAGGLILLFVLLGMTFPPFLWLAGLIGLGLAVAGITGFCGMAVLLQKMPWNKERGKCKGA